MEKIDILHVNYEKNNGLSKCQDVILEAKRAILNEQLDKIANITLAQVNCSRKTIEKCAKQCKDSLNWENDVFWQNLPPNPKNSTINKVKDISSVTVLNSQPTDIIGDLMKINRSEINTKLERKEKENKLCLMKKYFHYWKEEVKHKKEKRILAQKKLEQKEKLEKFVKKIKKHKKRETNCSKNEDCKNMCVENTLPLPYIYKNRYNAQKSIISMQKAKLEHQNKLIEELKLGIIREDLLKSIENTKTNIREIFSSCSNNVKCKVPVVIIEQSQQFKVCTQKAPKVIQQMEERAAQRAERRQIILERKRLIEETRQRMLEEAIENKRVVEEEERKKNLEIIKEKRKKELEQEKIRQANKQKYLDSLNKAVNLHNKKLAVKYFRELYNNFRENKEKTLLAKTYYNTKILMKSIFCWMDFVEDTYKIKYEIADTHFTFTILKKTFKIWRDVCIESTRNMQVAEDLYDFRLTSNTFIYWHRYVCTQITLQNKQLKLAEKHYNRKLLFHCFYLWRTLPAVIQLEKAKESKKRKWREKVWEILPDYKPPEDI